MDQFIILFRTIVAAILGGSIGWEREKADKPAGLRTNMLVSASACILVSLGNVIINSFASSLSKDVYGGVDPVRIIQAIIIGISFIGSGTIIKNQNNKQVMNLTTAASILTSATVGISIALSQYILGIGIAVLVIIINLILPYLEKETT